MPVDLHKKEEKDLMQIYAPYILITLIILLVLFIIALLFAVTGVHANTLTGTEANHWQNMQNII
ncbi:hypothetical protein [Methanobrevibacter sp.]